ncbi:hypothetical protein ABZV58_34510, partial [Nocardia sp. NPDC004654]|uniref:hypothetical protein n=1 Tax=Nocardia sp. NPDC004654 TaxID=3154776 RepID=UPI0033B03B92
AELMGGTLTSFIAFGRGHVFDRGGYIDTLLGPERTDVLSRQKDDPLGSSVSTAGLALAGFEIRF